jgi:hypothetical protein
MWGTCPRIFKKGRFTDLPVMHGNFIAENDEPWDGMGYPCFRQTNLGSQ